MTRTELLAVAKPILFNTKMVEAILDGSKTATRRAVKPRYCDNEGGFQVITTMSGGFIRVEKVDENGCGIFPDGTERVVNPPYISGDVLYVRETWCKCLVTPGGHLRMHGVYYYKTDGDLPPAAWRGNWKPSIHMPKAAARIFVRVTEVRAERLQDINGTSMEREGIKTGITHFKRPINNFGNAERFRQAQKEFSVLWNSTIKPIDLPCYGWDANPWVWVIEFERCEIGNQNEQ